MQKLTSICLAVAATLSISLTAHAQTAALTGAKILADDCDTVLLDDVTVSISSGVVGAWTCAAAANAVSVVACHTSGRKSERSERVPCRASDVAETEANKAVPVCDDDTVSTNVVTAKGVSFMRGSTAGGAVGPLPLDGAMECTQAVVLTK